MLDSSLSGAIQSIGGFHLELAWAERTPNVVCTSAVTALLAMAPQAGTFVHVGLQWWVYAPFVIGWEQEVSTFAAVIL